MQLTFGVRAEVTLVALERLDVSVCDAVQPTLRQRHEDALALIARINLQVLQCFR